MKYIWLCMIALAALSCGGGITPEDPADFNSVTNTGYQNSTAPVEWTAADGKFGASAINDLAYNGQKFFAVGDNGKLSWAWGRSPDEWTAHPFRDEASGVRSLKGDYPFYYAPYDEGEAEQPVPNGDSNQFFADENIYAVVCGGNDLIGWGGTGRTTDVAGGSGKLGKTPTYDLYTLDPAKKFEVKPGGLTRTNNGAFPGTANNTTRFSAIVRDITSAGPYIVMVGDNGRMSVNKDALTAFYPIPGFANKFLYDDRGNGSDTFANITDDISYNIYAIAFGHTKFVAAGEHGVISWAIPDATWKSAGTTVGTAWLTDPLPPQWTKADTSAAFGTDDIYALAYSPEGRIWAAAGANGKIAWSDDGANTWNQADSPFGASAVYALAWGGGKFLAGGEDGKLAYSRNGKTWTAVDASVFAANAVRAIAYGQGRFVAAGDSGVLAYSNGQEITNLPYYSVSSDRGAQ